MVQKCKRRKGRRGRKEVGKSEEAEGKMKRGTRGEEELVVEQVEKEEEKVGQGVNFMP